MFRRSRESMLTPEDLAAQMYTAYLQGAFPMDGGGGQVEYYTTDPRALLPIDEFRVPRTVQRILRQRRGLEVRVNTDFAQVVSSCGNRGHGDWLTPAMAAAYQVLHRHHLAHSVEVWEHGALVGGLFGVQIGAAFSADSMFHRAPDAGNVALVACAYHLRERGFHLWDIQMASDHTRRFGLYELTLSEYLEQLEQVSGLTRHFGATPPDSPQP